MVKIAPSILAANFGRLADEVMQVERAGADLIHIDIMDGHFVPNLTIGPVVVSALRKATHLPLEVHLMVTNAADLIPHCVEAGAGSVLVHVEACWHLQRTVQLIRDRGASPGVVLNPATPINTLDEILPEVETVLVMSVNPGFGGQKFLDPTLAKIRRLRETIDQRDLTVAIEVDGGIKTSNAHKVIAAGADILVSGTGIFDEQDYAAAIAQLRGGPALASSVGRSSITAS